MNLARRLLAVFVASDNLNYYLEAMSSYTAIRRRLRILSEHDPFSDPIGDPWQHPTFQEEEEMIQFPVAARKCSHRHPQHPVKAHGGTYATKECTACGSRWGLNHNTGKYESVEPRARPGAQAPPLPKHLRKADQAAASSGQSAASQRSSGSRTSTSPSVPAVSSRQTSKPSSAATMNSTHVEEAVAKALAAPMAMIQQLAQHVYATPPMMGPLPPAEVLMMGSSPPPEGFCGGYNPHGHGAWGKGKGGRPLSQPYPVRGPHPAGAPAAAAQAPGINVIHEAGVTEVADLSSTVSSDGVMTGTTAIGTGEEFHLSDTDAPTERVHYETCKEPPQAPRD